MNRLKTARPIAQLVQGKRDWYQIEALAGADTATVHIYDEVGYFGVTAADFIADLHGIAARNIDLRISSPGGSVFDGFAIFEALRAHPARVTTYVDSLAASIASVIALAGDRVVVGEFAEFMVHEASGLAIGNADEMRQMAEDLDRESTRIASVYAGRTGGTVDEWRSRMRAETWFSADEAVEAGLADEVARPARQAEEDVPAMAAKWDLSIFAYAGRENAPPPNLKRARPAAEPIPQLRDGQAPPLLVPEAVPVDAPLTLEQVAAAFGLPLNQESAPEGEPQAPDDAPADGPGEDGGGGEEVDAHGLAAALPDDAQSADDPPAEEPVAEAAEPPGDTSPGADAAPTPEPAINVCVQQSIRSDADVAALDPLDEWAELTAHLLETLTPPSSDDVLAAFREALL